MWDCTCSNRQFTLRDIKIFCKKDSSRIYRAAEFSRFHHFSFYYLYIFLSSSNDPRKSNKKQEMVVYDAVYIFCIARRMSYEPICFALLYSSYTFAHVKYELLMLCTNWFTHQVIWCSAIGNTTDDLRYTWWVYCTIYIYINATSSLHINVDGNYGTFAVVDCCIPATDCVMHFMFTFPPPHGRIHLKYFIHLHNRHRWCAECLQFFNNFTANIIECINLVFNAKFICIPLYSVLPSSLVSNTSTIFKIRKLKFFAWMFRHQIYSLNRNGTLPRNRRKTIKKYEKPLGESDVAPSTEEINSKSQNLTAIPYRYCHHRNIFWNLYTIKLHF